MKNGWILVLVFGCLILLTACGMVPPIPTLMATSAPLNQPAIDRTLSVNATSQVENNGPCAYQWATQSLPEESANLQTAFNQAELSDYQVKAVAYGENCVAGDGSIVSFSVMETDIYITAVVPDLQDHQDLGNRIYSVMQVLDQIDFALPGPDPGYLGVTFQQGTQKDQLWTRRDSVGQAISNGLRGSELLDLLQNH